jgi:hypothetical protein
MCLFSFTCFHHNNIALTGNGDGEKLIPCTPVNGTLQAPSQSTGRGTTSQTHSIPPGAFGFVKPRVVATPFWRRKETGAKYGSLSTEEPKEEAFKDERETLLSE